MERNKKEWLTKSPCRGCINCDSDTEMGALVAYCSIVTSIELFFLNYYGVENNVQADPRHRWVYKNCEYKNYLR